MNAFDIELRWLEAFIAVAEELHFGNAAARLRVAQSPLSQTIRRLERNLGEELFIRNTRSVELSVAGHALLPHARDVLEKITTATQAVKSTERIIHGNLSLGFSGVLNLSTLPVLTRALQKTHPGINLTLVGRTLTRDAVHKLESGALDLAFVGLPVESTRVHSRLLVQEVFGMVVPADHWSIDVPEPTLDQFSGEPFITPPLGSGSALVECTLRACADEGFYPNVAQEITDPYMTMVLVAAGLGVAFLPVGVSSVLPGGAVYIPLHGEAQYMNHGIAWSQRGGSPAREAFLALSEEVMPTPQRIM
jgi:DNA-binding transcriptional LysR family regulator